MSSTRSIDIDKIWLRERKVGGQMFHVLLNLMSKIFWGKVIWKAVT